MIIGLILTALGIIITIKANVGYDPWEVFHVGLSNTIGVSFGMTTIGHDLVPKECLFFAF
jgi:uncharacterized membrane protein YczE